MKAVSLFLLLIRFLFLREGREDLKKEQGTPTIHGGLTATHSGAGKPPNGMVLNLSREKPRIYGEISGPSSIVIFDTTSINPAIFPIL